MSHLDLKIYAPAWITARARCPSSCTIVTGNELLDKDDKLTFTIVMAGASVSLVCSVVEDICDDYILE